MSDFGTLLVKWTLKKLADNLGQISQTRAVETTLDGDYLTITLCTLSPTWLHGVPRVG